MEQPKKTTEKPQEGAWDKIKGYPLRVKFELDKAVTVTFSQDFEEPKEMPNTDGEGVYYIFNCMAEGKEASISTSAWTLLNNLKTHSPLAGKTLIITKKNVKGKNMYYVSTPENMEKMEDAKAEESEMTDSEKVSKAASEKLAELNDETPIM